jgi:hypothetical protein
MIDIAPAEFEMGSDGTAPADYDEFPKHRVRLTHPFKISILPLTDGQFRQFRMDYQDVRDAGRAEGISWYDAQSYCDWLSAREHKHYRLPTEAEWEYLAQLPASEQEKLGIQKLGGGLPEWTADWYGAYPSDEVSDPGGEERGWSRVVRGGPISIGADTHADPQRGIPGYFSRPTNRASVSPDYAGRHRIGFRVVEVGGDDSTTFHYTPAPFPERFVLQKLASMPKTVQKPHLRIRNLLPIPPDNMLPEANKAAGIDPAVQGHIHSAGAAACANGDVLWIAFSSLTPDSEYSPNTTFVISRLRYGSDSWDTPELFYDFADVNEQSALLWNDAGTIRFFGGGTGLDGVPFRMQQSSDCGATWTAPQLPQLSGHVGGYATQPITSAFRKDGAIFMASDATPDASMLWKSMDNGDSWQSAGDHTRGRHTAFVALRDGSILGLGGKNTNIDGYMPQFVTSDDGKIWTESKTPFPALNVNQRPTLIRLSSGRLFFACDLQNRQGKQPPSFKDHGALVALSDDEGRTWKMKTLPGVLPHEAGRFRDRKGWSPYFDDYGTLGYAIATQTPDGLIHLMGSMTHPSQEFELNEGWILSDGAGVTTSFERPGPVKVSEERYPSGAIRARTRGVTNSDGIFRLEGEQDWYFENGQHAYHVEYRDGQKIHLESSWSAPGIKQWSWLHHEDGRSVWTQYWPNGNTRHISHWRNDVANGEAQEFDQNGKLVSSVGMKDGDLVR